MEYTKRKNRGNTLEKRKCAWYTCIRLSSTKILERNDERNRI